jgi:hypothetical protein
MRETRYPVPRRSHPESPIAYHTSRISYLTQPFRTAQPSKRPLAAIQLPATRTAIRVHSARNRTTKRRRERNQHKHRKNEPEESQAGVSGRAHAGSIQVAVIETKERGDQPQGEPGVGSQQSTQKQKPNRRQDTAAIRRRCGRPEQTAEKRSAGTPAEQIPTPPRMRQQ